MPGTITSAPELTHVSRHGFWLLLGGEELLLPFEHFPWFRNATIAQLMQVEWPTPGHLYWPELDVDLAVESIRDPSVFPLLARQADQGFEGTLALAGCTDRAATYAAVPTAGAGTAASRDDSGKARIGWQVPLHR